MKKCFSCLLIVALLGLVGCQPNANGPQATAQSTSASSESANLGPQDSAALDAFIKEKRGIVIDVRTPAEYESGHIPGAMLLPLNDVAQKVTEMVPDKNTEIVVYCRSGNRSGQAAKIMNDLGYQHVYNFGGIANWKGTLEQGTPLQDAA